VNSWIEVSEERLQGNYRALTTAAGAETDVMAVVKANAYGHGAEVCAAALARAGARWFGVADVREGARVRRALTAAGFADARILVMCGLMPEDVEAIKQYRLTPVVWTREQFELLRGSCANVHLEVDSGMVRQGVRPGVDLELLLDAVSQVGGVWPNGMMTHFCAAEVARSEKTEAQRRRFEEAIEQVRENELPTNWVHAGSSSSVDNSTADAGWLEAVAKSVGARAMVRCGIALYGYCLPIDGAAEPKIRPTLRPVMTWKTRVIDLRQVAAGESVGYNATFTAPGPMRVALLPVGYADGLRRELSSTNAKPGGWVMIAGRDGSNRRANILGRVSMNLTTVDVTEIEGVQVGDEVVVLGDGVTADDHARVAGTISYEILCGVGVTS
jgi:alanine racemase